MSLQFQKNRLLSEFSTFGIGGPIADFVEVHSADEMLEAYAWARAQNIPVLVLGKGSNCLFNDEGFKGLVILNKIDFCNIQALTVEVGSGYSFSLLGVQTARRGLSGLEFASGIPATVGGAIFMNAGASGRETYESLHSVSYLHETGERREYKKSELQFAYRKSPFQSMKGCILSATFHLELSLIARKSQLEIVDYRMKTQPYKDKSIGCIFRNPSKQVSAGALIDQCGLKGYKIGGARVSDMHANFIVNTGGATAQNVLELIRIIQKRVELKAGIHLEPEIRLIP
jgi:UDP-N-acetylmuramate dehydrogenase